MQLWFQENHNEDLRIAYKVKDVLFRGRSEFQTVEILETESYGRMMVIDEMVMVTEADEFVYHELIAHVPALLHPHPQHAVVIGGGDGGTIRELLRHPSFHSIVMCEIDALVIEAAKDFLPTLSQGFSDARTTIKIGDGIDYIKKLPDATVDLIVIDSTDPIGPGESLFTKEFYGQVARCLAPRGIMVCQSESAWYDRKIHQKIQGNLRSCFAHVKPYIGFVPSYPQGLWTWTLASHDPLETEAFSQERFSQIKNQLRYLNEELLHSCFALPNFYQNKINDYS